MRPHVARLRVLGAVLVPLLSAAAGASGQALPRSLVPPDRSSPRAASVLAEALLAFPHLAFESIDAHLIRLCTWLGGLAITLTLVVSGVNELRISVYGIVAGVGGLTIAPAAAVRARVVAAETTGRPAPPSLERPNA
jgi:hypothetical protein